MLDQDGDETLKGSTDCAMNYHRPVLGVVLAHVDEVESLRGFIVELNRAELPLAADGVRHVEVDLGPVEGAVPGLELVGEARRLERRLERGFRAIPSRVGPDPLRRAGG